MIPILFSSNETQFTTNGLGRLADCTRCEVTEERNGMFEVEFDYPISGKMYDKIDIGTLILCTHDDTGDTQPFEVYMRTAPIDGLVTFNARHLSYRLGMIPTAPFTASSVTQSLANFPTNAMITCPFAFWTDKTSTGSFKVTTPQTIRSLLGGSEGSILDVYGGGEYEWDKWTVKLYQNRGQDTDVTIRYGKNMLDITHTLDAENLYNAIVPYWAKDDEVVYGSVTKGTGVTAATVAITKDFTSEFEEKPTAAQLNTKAQTFLDSNQPWVPKQNIKVDFVQLWQTEDYKDVAALQRVGLCDTVSVIYPELGVTAERVKIIRVVYDVLRDRYSEMELGEAKTSFTEVIQERTEALVADKPSYSMMQAAIDYATDLIRGGLGGHVVISTNADGEPEEILIMDTDDVNTAVKVWRWNLGGLGYSSNGVNGPYTTAITQNGEIVADFITTGEMSANHVRAGLIEDELRQNSWNLDTGDFTITKGTFNVTTSNADSSAIRLEYGTKSAWLTPSYFAVSNGNETSEIWPMRIWLSKDSQIFLNISGNDFAYHSTDGTRGIVNSRDALAITRNKFRIYSDGTNDIHIAVLDSGGAYQPALTVKADGTIDLKTPLSTTEGGTGVSASSLDDAGILTKSGTQVASGMKMFPVGSGFYHDRWAQIQFFRSGSRGDANMFGMITTIPITVNGKQCMSHFRFREDSYNTSGDHYAGYYEDYALPSVDANRTSSAAYQILTTKSNVISRSAVRFSAKVSFAANETKIITLTGTFPSGFSPANLTGIVAQNTGNGNVVFITISAPITATSMEVTCRNFSTSALSNITVSVTYDLMKQNY